MRRYLGLFLLWGVCIAAYLVGCDAVDLSDTPVSKVEGEADAVGSSGLPVTPEDDGEGDVLLSTLVDDADEDGVEDDRDECPDTARGEEVDEAGCFCAQLDSDGDGANDCEDECPENPYRIEAGAEISFGISFDDPVADYSEYYADIERHLAAAGADWAQHLVAVRDVSIEVRVEFAEITTATAASETVVFVENNGTYNVFEQGVAAEIRTGVDPNGDVPDATVRIGIGNLTEGRWWFDPAPEQRTEPVPGDRIDAYSTLLHEMGHVLAYNGWRDPYTGEMRGDFQSTYDEMSIFDGADFLFVGEKAMEVYGEAVPETYGNCRHVGNREPRPGSDLLDQLMNGVANRRGWRRYISELDLAILADVGLPVRGTGADVDGCGAVMAARSLPSHSPRLGPAPVQQDGPGRRGQSRGAHPRAVPQRRVMPMP